MLDNKRIVIFHNILSPYKTFLFNEMFKIHKDITVIYVAKTENRRDWFLDEKEIKFKYEIMFDAPLDFVPPGTLFTRTWNRLNALTPDLVIIDGYSYASCWAGFLWSKLHRRPVVLWSSSNLVDHARIWHREWIKKVLVARCDAYNVYGSRSHEYLMRLGAKKEKIFIVGNNTDNVFYSSQVEKFKGKKDALCEKYGLPKKNFLYVGRFASEKNLLNFLKSYQKIRRERCGWGLILVGDGPLKREIEDYILRYDVPDVLLPGFKQKEEIAHFFAISNILVLPSFSEPWGLVVNEAMASGLPVLVSKNCGCYPDLVNDGENGFSFNPQNNEELLELMWKIVDDKVDLQIMGSKARQIVGNFTPERAARVISQTVTFCFRKARS